MALNREDKPESRSVLHCTLPRVYIPLRFQRSHAVDARRDKLSHDSRDTKVVQWEAPASVMALDEALLSSQRRAGHAGHTRRPVLLHPM